jgi:threonine aldolase
MRAVMMSAPVGDDVYGDDPTANSLEERVATLFDLEACSLYTHWFR